MNITREQIIVYQVWITANNIYATCNQEEGILPIRSSEIIGIALVGAKMLEHLLHTARYRQNSKTYVRICDLFYDGLVKKNIAN